MNNAKHFFTRHFALTLVLPLTLVACGGEESSTIVSSTDPAVAAALQQANGTSAQLTRSGTVALPEGVANALVCLDLKGTGVCDASAATVTRTRGDGSYAIRYQPKDAADAEDFKAAALLAEIPTDQGNYTLSSPGRKSNDINPLTTLVYRQMLQSATLDAAEQEVARQLDIDVDAIYHPNRSSVAMAAASLTNYSLKNGIATLVRTAPEAQDNTPQLVSFHFKDIHNYEYDVHTPEGSANAAGQILWRPVYGGKINGNDRTPENAAYTATIIDGFTATGREEYLKNGALQLFSADNQFTSILLNRQATAKAAKLSRTNSEAGYAVETTVQKMDISGQSMQTFFGDPASYQVKLKNIVHLNAFKVEDSSSLANAVFPEGSVLHIQLSTPIGNKNSIEYAKTQSSANVVSVSRSTTTYASTLEQRANDLNPAQELHATRALVVKYALNDRAWTATKEALHLP
ncbi:hypothetical protein [Pantoea sp. 18069]|uniref:hypothetical protein n=1 Tax=Pantoea sp. 18069 TaxID=2681415 RepID=UPI00135AD18E|nr:hypothetical protein [Pantoea sp. 18069]